MSRRGIYSRDGDLFGYLANDRTYTLDGTQTGSVQGRAVYDLDGNRRWEIDGDALLDRHANVIGYLGEPARRPELYEEWDW